jgi:chitinase
MPAAVRLLPRAVVALSRLPANDLCYFPLRRQALPTPVSARKCALHFQKIRLTTVTAIAVLLMLSSAIFPAWAKTSRSKPLVVAYVFKRNDIIQPGEIAANKLTRINYAFALIKEGEIVNGYSNDDQNLAALVALKKDNPSLTVLVSVGGWLGSGNFSDMALTKHSRSVFIESVIKYVDLHQLDGLDIDWEYPGLPGAGNRFRPEDKQNYTSLLKELRKRFDQHEKEVHRRLYLTVATGAQSDFLANTEMNKVQKYVDTVNLMAYDYYEPDSDKITGHHAPLFTDPEDPKKISADQSVREYEQAGVPAAKLVLGVPFYGHVWEEVDDTGHGLYQPGTKAPNTFAHYGNILDSMINHGFIRYWDGAAAAPYLYNPDKKIFVSYEDPESLALKCKYVREHKLGGIMFWEYSADPSGTLLDTVDQGLWGKSSSPGPQK